MSNGSTSRSSRPRSDERRKGEPPAPVFGELLLEAQWEPSGTTSPETDAWLRAKGAVPERRSGADRRDRR